MSLKTTNDDITELNKMRKKMFLTACDCKSAHLASAFSMTEIFYVLYAKGVLRIDPRNPYSDDRDRLILSKGHGSLALYVSLALKGLISEEELDTFVQPDSRLGGEPCMNGIPGVEAATGSLGHGLSIGVGMALAGKLDKKNYQTYVILGDGECQEGSIWEAVMAAYKFELGNLTVILDCNSIQKMGYIKDMMRIASWREKWQAFGWQVDEICEGHNIEEIASVLTAPHEKDVPRIVIAHTVKGRGVSIMEGDPSWHFKMPNKRETKIFMKELGISEEELKQCKRLI